MGTKFSRKLFRSDSVMIVSIASFNDSYAYFDLEKKLIDEKERKRAWGAIETGIEKGSKVEAPFVHFINFGYNAINDFC